MILIRASGKIDYSELPSLPPAIAAILSVIPGYTEINSDQSLLDGRYTASELRLVADVMEWHSQNEQKPLEFFNANAQTQCLKCGKIMASDLFYDELARAYCLQCALTLATV